MILVVFASLLVVLGLGAQPSQARGVGKVSHLARVGQDWNHARLKVAWRGVKGATYQMRYSTSAAGLKSARVITTRTSSGTYTGVVSHRRTWLVQVRAVRGGAAGPWSRARGLRLLEKWPGKFPAAATGTHGAPGAVTVNWRGAPYGARYRVQWAPTWYGHWPGAPTYARVGWMGSSARAVGIHVPTTPQSGDRLLPVPYGNPVFAKVEANNPWAYTQPAIVGSRWVAAWPTPPQPAAGDPVRFGTYNVMLSPTGARAGAVAHNIAAHGLTMVALQEAGHDTVDDIVSTLGPSWRAVSPGEADGRSILYRTDDFSLLGSGSFGVYDPRNPSTPLQMPYGKFRAVNSLTNRAFYAVSLHMTEVSSKSAAAKDADTGRAARDAVAAINYMDQDGSPVVLGGDLRYGAQLTGEAASTLPAQPTFVRAGYYDAIATQVAHNRAYSSNNSVNGVPNARQAPHPSGLGNRADNILMKGIVGSRTWTQVVNWTYGGIVPSDHNMIYSDLMIPSAD